MLAENSEQHEAAEKNIQFAKCERYKIQTDGDGGIRNLFANAVLVKAHETLQRNKTTGSGEKTLL